MRWVVQENLGKDYAEQIREACGYLGHEYIGTKVVPFNHKLPAVWHHTPTVFYGATNWISLIAENNKWEPGVFFNPESVFTTWIKYYKENALNYPAEITTFKELMQRRFVGDPMFFVRPISDQKEFAGGLLKYSEIYDWADKLMTNAPDIYTLPIVVAEPLKIEHEWRLFIVKGKVVAGSQYRFDHRYKTRPGYPYDVADFAEERAKEYSPAPVFVMDIGVCGGKYYVIEIGCFNSAGLYEADTKKIVEAVSSTAACVCQTKERSDDKIL